MDTMGSLKYHSNTQVLYYSEKAEPGLKLNLINKYFYRHHHTEEPCDAPHVHHHTGGDSNDSGYE